MDIIYNNFVAAAFDMSSFALPLPGSGLPLLQLVKATVCPASAATRYGHYIRCVIIGVWPAVAVTREGEFVLTLYKLVKVTMLCHYRGLALSLIHI